MGCSKGRRRRGGGQREGDLAGEREKGMRLPEGEAWLVLTGCGADRLRRARVQCSSVSPEIDGVSL